MSHKLGRRSLREKVAKLEKISKEALEAAKEASDLLHLASVREEQLRATINSERKRAAIFEKRLDNLPNPFKFRIERDMRQIYQISMCWDMKYVLDCIIRDQRDLDVSREIYNVANEVKYRLEKVLLEHFAKERMGDAGTTFVIRRT